MNHTNNSKGFVGAWQNMKTENKALQSKILEYEQVINNLHTTSNKNIKHQRKFMMETINTIENSPRIVNIETQKLQEPAEEDREKTEEEREEREEIERAKAVLEKLAKKKAERKAREDIHPLREDKIKYIERERDNAISTENIYNLKIQMDEAVTKYNEALERIHTFDARIEAVKRGDQDAELIAWVGNRTLEIANKEYNKVVNDGAHIEKRERTIINRPPLYNVICCKTHFKTSVRGKEIRCYTTNGRIIYGDDDEQYKSINEWCNKNIIKILGENKTKKSIYEVVYVFYEKNNEWYKLKDVYNESSNMLTPI